MEQVERSAEFVESMKEGAGDIVDGAVGLVTDPLDTVGGAVSGVGRLFQRAGDSLFGDPPSEAEESR